jgi:hypothetical protein
VPFSAPSFENLGNPVARAWNSSDSSGGSRPENPIVSNTYISQPSFDAVAGKCCGSAKRASLISWSHGRCSPKVTATSQPNCPPSWPTIACCSSTWASRSSRIPARRGVREAAWVIHHKDAPILAAARQAGVDYLVTWNTRHFHTAPVRAFGPFAVMTPGEFLQAFRRRLPMDL